MSWATTRITLNREQLFNEGWQEPAQKVAAKYGISGTALAKICRKLNVPLPPRGYWARKSAGQNLRIPRLPRISADAPTEHQICRSQRSWEAHGRSTASEEAIQRERTAEARIIVVPGELNAPHPLILASLPLLKKAGLRAKEVTAKSACIDVVVSSDQVPRALRIMDALLKALEMRGLTVEVTKPVVPPERRYRWDCSDQPSQPAKTGVHIGNAFLEFRLEEQLEAVWLPGARELKDAGAESRIRWRLSHPGPGYEHRATGRLALKLCSHSFLGPSRQTWRDGKRQRLELMLNDFMAVVIDLAEKHRLWQEARALEEQRRQEEERLRAEEARCRQIEEGRVADLNRRIEMWHSAADIEEVATAVERSDKPAKPAREWLQWARERAARLRASAVETPSLQGEPAFEADDFVRDT